MRHKIVPILGAIEHKRYVEAFGGSAAILCEKESKGNDVYNDADGRVSDFFLALADAKTASRLKEIVDVTPCGREIYEKCRREWVNSEDLVLRAFSTFYVQNFSFGGRVYDSFGTNKIFVGTSQDKNQVASYNVKRKNFDKYVARFQDVVVERLDYRELFEKYDYDGALFYCDPPYDSPTKPYRFEGFDFDSREFVESVVGLEGKVVVSCYFNDVYARLSSEGWLKIDYASKTCVSRDKTIDDKRIETLLVSPSARLEVEAYLEEEEELEEWEGTEK